VGPKPPQECLASAHECERLAAEALTDHYRDVFLTLAARWRTLAVEQREIDRRNVPVDEIIAKVRAISLPK